MGVACVLQGHQPLMAADHRSWGASALQLRLRGWARLSGSIPGYVVGGKGDGFLLTRDEIVYLASTGLPNQVRREL